MNEAIHSPLLPDLTIRHDNDEPILRARYGSITNLIPVFGPRSWQFAKGVLLLESQSREALLEGNQAVAPRHDWIIRGLSKVELIPFSPRLSGRVSVMSVLELGRPLFEMFSLIGSHACPRCGEAMPQIDRQGIAQKMVSSLTGETIAICAEFSGNAPAQFVLTLTGGTITQRDDADSSESEVVIDHFLLEPGSTRRMHEALSIAFQERPNLLRLYARGKEKFTLHEQFELSPHCRHCGHIPTLLTRAALTAPIDSSESIELQRSLMIGSTSLFDVLRRPIGDIPREIESGALEILREYGTPLMSSRLTLASPIRSLSAPESQRLLLLKHLVRQTCDSVFAIEEPLAAAAPSERETIFAVLSDIAKGGNAVLVIDGENLNREKSSEGAHVIENAEQLLTLLKPGAYLLNQCLGEATLEHLLEQANFKSASVANLVPGKTLTLEALGASEEMVADECDLVEPLLELYESLPLAKIHGLKGELLRSPAPGQPAPEFKGYTVQQLLKLDVSSAQRLLEHIPRCAAPLKALSELGLGDLALDAEVSQLSLAARNLLRISLLNSRRGKFHRVFHLEYPLAGLNPEQTKLAVMALATIPANGHILLLTGVEPDMLPFEFERIDTGGAIDLESPV